MGADIGTGGALKHHPRRDTGASPKALPLGRGGHRRGARMIAGRQSRHGLLRRVQHGAHGLEVDEDDVEAAGIGPAAGAVTWAMTRAIIGAV